MTRTRSGLGRTALVLSAGALGVCLTHAALAGSPDSSKVVGAQTCGECHIDEVEAWKQSHHYTTYTTLPRSDKAREIADALGIRRIKAESDCLSCHFTQEIEENEPTPISGISCESCHGAAADWLDVHNDLGDYTEENEPAEHREARLQRAAELGMLRPSDLYGVAANCYSCHSVPNEHLVNTGGHIAGSDFDLVAWSQGEVRHNFIRSGGDSNAESTQDQLRRMYVVGKLLDMEYTLRGIAKATEKGDYTRSMVGRYKRSLKDLEAIQAASPSKQVEQAIAIAKEAPIKLNHEKELIAAANKLGAQASDFADSVDGASLAGVDALLPKPSEYHGDAYQK